MNKAASDDEPVSHMNRADYRAWALGQPSGRYERVNGVVVAMGPERAGHNKRKALAGAPSRRTDCQAGLRGLRRWYDDRDRRQRL